MKIEWKYSIRKAYVKVYKDSWHVKKRDIHCAPYIVKDLLKYSAFALGMYSALPFGPCVSVCFIVDPGVFFKRIIS